MEGKEEKLSERFIEAKSFSGSEYDEMEMPDVRTLIEIVKLETHLEIALLDDESYPHSIEKELNSIAQREGIK